MDALLFESIDRFLTGGCPPASVREVEAGRGTDALWAAIEASGYADLLVPESASGAGLGLPDAFALWLACGRHALPLPLGPTAWVRGVLARFGIAAPSGPLTMAVATRRDADGTLHCQGVPFGAVADWVLVDAALLPVAAGERHASGVHGSLQAHIRWPSRPAGALLLPQPADVLHAGALVSAALMAGAMQRVLDATLTYANQREQFGKPIGKFQAVQQQLAVMAEQVFAARMSAEIGCTGDGVAPQPLRAALAKARAGEAADKVVAIAHAVHGAIGATAEYDLQLYTRRLQQGRGEFGSSAYWQAELGRALLAAREPVLPFMLEQVLPR
jgi:alkylation response protein AidB-like acyl-CoA dehydrogenase